MKETPQVQDKKKWLNHSQSNDGKPFFQPKLTINQPSDMYEKEADVVAEKMMNHLGTNQSNITESIDTEQEDEILLENHIEDTVERIAEKDIIVSDLQIKKNDSNQIQSTEQPISQSLGIVLRKTISTENSLEMDDEISEEILDAVDTPSHELDFSIKSEMESAFGQDFSGVKIHNKNQAAVSADNIHAAAYTYKNHIIFGERQYQPHTKSGKKLIAHELTHTLQNRGDLISKSENEEVESEVIAPVPDSLIISDGDTPEMGQLTKAQFLNLLYDQVCNVLRESLSTRGFDENNCPRLTLLFGILRWRSASQLDRLIREYEPRSSEARTAVDYLTIITDRIRISAQSWIQSGEILNLPEALQSEANRVFSILPRALQLKSHSEINERPSKFENLTLKEVGRPLDSRLKMRMESAFREDFSEVKIHNDSEAHQKTVQLNARAFTLGNNIVFGESQYKPGTPIGDALIAHELAHIIQQRNGLVNNASQTNSDYTQLETDADQAATGVLMNLYLKARAGIHEWASNVKPSLQTGLKVQACSGPIHTYNDLTQAQKDLLMRYAMQHVSTSISPEPSNNIYYTGVNYAASVVFPHDDPMYTQPNTDNPFDFIPFVYKVETWNEAHPASQHEEYSTDVEGDPVRFSFTSQGSYIVNTEIQIAPDSPVIRSRKTITVHAIDELITPLAPVDISQMGEITTTYDKLQSYEAAEWRIIATAKGLNISPTLIDSWLAANASVIPIEQSLRNRISVDPATRTAAIDRIRDFYTLYRTTVAPLDYTEYETISDPTGGGGSIERAVNDFIGEGRLSFIQRELGEASTSMTTIISTYLNITRTFHAYLASRLRQTGHEQEGNQLTMLSGTVSNIRTVYREHPDAIPIPAVFYPTTQSNDPSSGQSFQPEKYPLQFFIYRTGTGTQALWHLIDATNPNREPIETEAYGGTDFVPPRDLFTELDNASRFPLGHLYWKLPGQSSIQHHETVHPLTWSQFFQYLGIIATVAAITLATAGAGAIASYAVVVAGLAGAAGAIADMAEKSNLGVLTAQDVALDVLTIVTSLATAGTAHYGRIITASANVTVTEGTATANLLSRARMAETLYRPLAGVSLVGDAISLGVFTRDMVTQIETISGNTGLNQTQKNEAMRRLVLQGLLTGGMMILAVRGDIADFRMERRIYFESAPGGRTTARLLLNDSDLLAHASISTHRTEMEAVLRRLDSLPTSSEVSHQLRGEISAALSTGVTDAELTAFIGRLHAAGDNMSEIARLVEDFRQGRTASVGGVGARGSYTMGSTALPSDEFHRTIQRDFSATARGPHASYSLAHTGRGSQYNLTVQNSGTPITISVNIRLADFSGSTSTAGLASHATDSGPARFTLRMEGGRWVGTIEVNQHITSGDIHRAMRHEMGEMSDIVQQLNGTARTLTPDQLQTRIAAEQNPSLFVPTALTSTARPHITAHDRATIEELQTLIDEVNRGVAGSQFNLRARLRETGLFRDMPAGTTTGYRAMFADIDLRVGAIEEAGMHTRDIASLEYELTQLFGVSTFPRAEFLARYTDENMRFNFETGRWYNIETTGRTVTRQFFTSAEMADQNLAFNRLTVRPAAGTSSSSMSSFVPFYEMLTNSIPPIVNSAAVRAKFDQLISSPNGRDLDFVRHELKSHFRSDIVSYLTDSPRLATKYPHVPFAEATHRELLAVTSNINPSDKGNIAEDWYRAAYAPTALQHIRFTDSTGTSRFPDLLHSDGTLHDLKYVADNLSQREITQFEEYKNMIGHPMTYTNSSGSSTSILINKLQYSFLNPHGAVANSPWILRVFTTSTGTAHISFELFDNLGRKIIVRNDGIYMPPSTVISHPLSTLSNASSMRTLLGIP